MKTLDFPEVNVRIAEKQEEFSTLPAYYNSEEGSITYGFELSLDEIEKIVKTGKIWVKQLTYGNAMQPLALGFEKEDFI